MRIGIVGYGTGGRHFHAPFIEAAEGIELAGIVTRSPERRALAAAEWPGVPLFDSLGAMLDSGVDAVTITTPPETRRELVLEAVGRGVHVVADKPFAPDAATGRELTAAALSAGVALNVFHNRRWDADIRTLAKVLADGQLGTLTRVESRFDLDDPNTLEPGPNGGLLRDLGSHVVDQAIWLLGPVASVYANLDWLELPEGRTDSSFMVVLTHVSGVRSYVSSTKLNHLAQREFRAYGSGGSYIASGNDVQAQAIFAGLRPADEPSTWGYDVESAWGTLHTASGAVKIPSEQGSHQTFYTEFAAAVAGTGPEPVPAAEAVHTLQLLDAARLSDATGQVVVL